jgi:hypothetical protein
MPPSVLAEPLGTVARVWRYRPADLPRPSLAGRVPFHHDNAALGTVILPTIVIHVIADCRPVRHGHMLVQDGPPDPHVAADLAVSKNDRVLDERAAVDVHIAAQDRVADASASQHAPV